MISSRYHYLTKFQNIQAGVQEEPEAAGRVHPPTFPLGMTGRTEHPAATQVPVTVKEPELQEAERVPE